MKSLCGIETISYMKISYRKYLMYEIFIYFLFIYLLCHHTYTFIGWETTTAIANYSGPNSYTETIYKVY